MGNRGEPFPEKGPEPAKAPRGLWEGWAETETWVREKGKKGRGQGQMRKGLQAH